LAAWHIEVLGDHLAQWPEAGNLLHLDEASIPTILEVDDTGAVIGVDSGDTDSSAVDQHSHGLVHDGLDMGPAPLQNAVAPDEVFEGVAAIGTDGAGSASLSLVSWKAYHLLSVCFLNMRPFT
jgi:hypothetical protein